MTVEQMAALARDRLAALHPRHLPPHLTPVAVAVTGTDQLASLRLVRILEAHGLHALASHEPGYGHGVFVAVCDASVAAAVLSAFAGGRGA